MGCVDSREYDHRTGSGVMTIELEDKKCDFEQGSTIKGKVILDMGNKKYEAGSLEVYLEAKC